MTIKTIIYLVYIIFAFLLFSLSFFKMLYYFQLDGYQFKSLFKTFWWSVKEYYLAILLCVILQLFCVIYLILNNTINDYLAVFILLVVTIVLFLLGNKFRYLHKIHYTKRILRFIICNFLFYLVLLVLMMVLLHCSWLVIVLPINIFFAYIVANLSCLIMSPIENVINNYYINMAKNKLEKMGSLVKIGITGSYGKTSTKEILYSILNNHYNVLATEKSFNTPLGITKTINTKLRNTHEVFVCEMGAKKRGEIKELCDFVEPEIGIVTSVGRQHLETFRTINDVYKTKKELPDNASIKKCVFNMDNCFVRKMYNDFDGCKIGVFLLTHRECIVNHAYLISKRKIFKFSKRSFCNNKYFTNSKLNNVYAKNIFASESGLNFDVYYNGDFLFSGSSSLLGIHNVTNILLSIGVAIMLHVPTKKIIQGISALKAINARIEKIVYNNGAVVINNGYNANLDSSKETLKVLSLFNKSHKVVITPGLVECVNMFEYNKLFGKLIAGVATEVIVVKRINRDAITEGLIECNFSGCNIKYVDNFNEAKNLIECANEDYVFLIENDLPENYR